MSRPQPKLSTTTKVVTASTPAPDDDLYAVAMLKVAMELKRENTKGFEDVFEETLAALDVDRQAFRSYLTRHMDKLLKTARKRNY